MQRAENPQLPDQPDDGPDDKETAAGCTKSSSVPKSDPLVKFQAILAGLPMHALRQEHCGGCCCASRRGGCLCCCHPWVIDHLPWVLPCNEQIEIALLEARRTYPQYKEELGRLRVVHASHDLTIFVDDLELRMFTSLRGTDCRTCRDLCNDLLIIGGCWLCRTKWARAEYCHARRILGANYASYGCGHSLGGTVMTELAHILENDELFKFTRVDVFNTGGSPLSRGYVGLSKTVFFAHRVPGDWVSRFFHVPGIQEHPQRPEHCSHSLHHFLPERVADGIDAVADGMTLWTDCAGIRIGHSASSVCNGTDGMTPDTPAVEAMTEDMTQEEKELACSPASAPEHTLPYLGA